MDKTLPVPKSVLIVWPDNTSNTPLVTHWVQTFWDIVENRLHHVSVVFLIKSCSRLLSFMKLNLKFGLAGFIIVYILYNYLEPKVLYILIQPL